MISLKNKTKKTNAQAMVEFALALPILLLILYGLLETGRLMFIYASTVTAARQAVRYGSATGVNSSNVPYYQDCSGIQAAANRVGFINTFSNISISYDRGLAKTDVNGDGSVNEKDVAQISSPAPTCPIAANTIQNGDRIIVSVSSQWTPIVPLVPFDPFTITSTSERTILVSVSIAVTAPPQAWNGTGSGLAQFIVPSASAVIPSSTTYSYAGQVISFQYVMQNVGSADLSNPAVIDSIAGTNCSTSTVVAGDTFTCTGTYVITQADMDAGSVTSIAYPSGNSSNTVTTTLTAIQSPALSLSITSSPAATFTAGTNVTFTYTITNTGNVSLTDFSISDNPASSVNCSGATSPLLPLASTECTSTYTITVDDINNGIYTKSATAAGLFKSAPVTSNNASVNVLTTPIALTISTNPSTATIADGIVTYTYYIQNLSSQPVTGISITDDKKTVDCSSVGTISAGATKQCTATYTVTKAMFDSGITNIISTATASGTVGGQTVNSNTAEVNLPVVKTPAITLVITPNVTNATSPTNINYTYAITNSGNVTLSGTFAVTDTKGISVICSDQSPLAAGATRNCTGSRALTSADDAAGSFTNTATASATYSSSPVTSSQASATVITYSGARFNVTLAADPTVVTQSGTVIGFTYTITNTGGVVLTSPYVITSSLGNVDCSLAVTPLALGSSTTCSSAYTVNAAGTVTNNVTAATAKNNVTSATVNATGLPVSVSVPAYICTNTTLKYTVTQTFTDSKSDTVVWTINNTVGTSLPISSITVYWNNSGNTQLNSMALSNGGSVTATGLPSPGPNYTSGSGTLNTGTTNLTLTFSKNKVTDISVVIQFSAPYTGCQLP